jgi:endonuclease-3 related protein
MRATQHEAIRAYYDTLFSAWGCQHWWPAQSRFEMIVGAFLTQNTAWTNVEKALANLRRTRHLTISGIRSSSQAELESLIRPSGYFRQKAQRLKAFVEFLDERYGGSLTRMFARPTAQLRDELLALNGVGPETADSILLYAGNHPAFVVDAYTRRILERHQVIASGASYEEIRELFEHALFENSAAKKLSPPRRRENLKSKLNRPLVSPEGLPESLGVSAVSKNPAGCSHRPSRVSSAKRDNLVQVFNEMHGLIVGVGKNYCLKSQPRCELCPLQKFLPQAE